MYLLDTNICIYGIKKNPETVFKKLSKVKIENVAISSITWHELYYGVLKSSKAAQNLKALNNFISSIRILDFTKLDSEKLAAIRLDLEKQGRPIGTYDMQIAAHALNENLILVTNNEREFSRVIGLKIENWVQ
jgi:tRNA(fMet)-specific endonuclease VapC